MSDIKERLSSSEDDETENKTEKRTYEKPQIIYRAPLEAMAAVCAPSPPAKGNPGVCPSGPISS
ncbi:MAG TPA: hypothetical protein VLR90_14975 [Blastocatellia bacterium]|jgi:hypothetical protein|nr:hypothetical protein [Blastocatellia bacterium]